MSFQEYVEKTAPKARFGKIDGRIVKGFAIIAALAVVVILFGVANASESGEFEVIHTEDSTETAADSDEQNKDVKQAPQICVYVTGAVQAPGICYLDEGARISDAIDAVGGFTPDAAKESINLAQLVTDGQQINISTVDELEQATIADASAQQSFSDSSTPTVKGKVASDGKVNINTATSEELQTLSGVGKSKAEKIIAYRQNNGAFKSVDELTNVSGIGEKTLESLRSHICV